MKKALKISAIVVGLLLVCFIGSVVAAFAGSPSFEDGTEVNGVARIVKDGYSSVAFLEVGDGTLALIDCGMDKEGKPLLAELARRKLGPEAVSAIFLTHGHGDHVGACHLFPKAQIYALEREVAAAEGREGFHGPLTQLMPVKASGLHVTRGLRDGETVTVGGLSVQVFAVPGHTAGSAAYLAKEVLFLGDSADATKDGKLAPAKWPVTDDRAQNRQSLVALANRLKPMPAQVKALVFSHTGTLPGLNPLLDFAASEGH